MKAFLSPSLAGGGWAAREPPDRPPKGEASCHLRPHEAPGSLQSWLSSHLPPQPTRSSCPTPGRIQGILISSETLVQALRKEGALVLGTKDPAIVQAAVLGMANTRDCCLAHGDLGRRTGKIGQRKSHPFPEHAWDAF